MLRVKLQKCSRFSICYTEMLLTNLFQRLVTKSAAAAATVKIPTYIMNFIELVEDIKDVMKLQIKINCLLTRN